MASFMAKLRGEKKATATPASKVKSNKLVLLIIDPQNDFHPGGSLGVPGAIEDSQRTADFIEKHISEIDEIYVSLDTHHKLHIAHGPFWKNAEGESPAPFTQITNKEICDGVWMPRLEKHLEWCKHYTSALEAKGRYTLIIWPEHCIIGTNGHNVFPALNDSLQKWSQTNMKTINYSRKGEECLTEMYSAISAEIPLPTDPVNFKADLYKGCVDTEKLVVCGQALSHCVNFTVRDIHARVVETGDLQASDMYLLADASSPVPGFEANGTQFIEDIRSAGMNITTSVEFTP
jgi:nicotinamidase-related amidase